MKWSFYRLYPEAEAELESDAHPKETLCEHTKHMLMCTRQVQKSIYLLSVPIACHMCADNWWTQD